MMVQPGLWGERLVVGELRDRILALCRREPALANSDRRLAIALWQEEGLEEAIEGSLERFSDWFVEEATGFETISRAARQLRAEGLIRADPTVAQARQELAEHHRRYWKGER